MNEAPRAPGAPVRNSGGPAGEQPCYAALDLGTNNCRLLIATPTGGGFRVVEAYSRIVRLGEGLSQSGKLSDAAMERAMARNFSTRRRRTFSALTFRAASARSIAASESRPLCESPSPRRTMRE